MMYNTHYNKFKMTYILFIEFEVSIMNIYTFNLPNAEFYKLVEELDKISIYSKIDEHPDYGDIFDYVTDSYSIELILNRSSKEAFNFLFYVDTILKSNFAVEVHCIELCVGNLAKNYFPNEIHNINICNSTLISISSTKNIDNHDIELCIISQ